MKTLTNRPARTARYTPAAWVNPWERLFRNDFPDLWEGEERMTIPSINITDEKKNYLVEMAAPGLKKEDFNIEMDGNMLTISCEKETEREEQQNGKNFSRREYNYSSFSRSFTIPENTDTENIDARYENGILRLSIPKKVTSQSDSTRKISVH